MPKIYILFFFYAYGKPAWRSFNLQIGKPCQNVSKLKWLRALWGNSRMWQQSLHLRVKKIISQDQTGLWDTWKFHRGLPRLMFHLIEWNVTVCWKELIQKLNLSNRHAGVACARVTFNWCLLKFKTCHRLEYAEFFQELKIGARGPYWSPFWMNAAFSPSVARTFCYNLLLTHRVFDHLHLFTFWQGLSLKNWRKCHSLS